MAYATTTRTRRNIEEMRKHDLRLLITPDITTLHDGFHYAIDNGAWGAFQRGDDIDFDAFEALVDDVGADADFVVVPDIVCGGVESLRRSEEWLARLEGRCRLLLVPVQNGFTPDDVRAWLGAGVGIFVGGDTEWKLSSLPVWGELALDVGCHLHVARVNTKNRIRRCALAGAHSFDGTSATRFGDNAEKIDRWRAQQTLTLVGEA